jgi:hypothetical protein
MAERLVEPLFVHKSSEETGMSRRLILIFLCSGPWSFGCHSDGRPSIPPMDRATPQKTETATFAFG